MPKRALKEPQNVNKAKNIINGENGKNLGPERV